MLKRILATIGLGASLIVLPSAASAQSGHSFHFRSQSHMPPPGVHFRGGGFGSGHGFVAPGHRFHGPRHHFFAPRFHRPPHRFGGHFPRGFRGHSGPPPGFSFRGHGFGHGFGGGFGHGFGGGFGHGFGGGFGHGFGHGFGGGFGGGQVIIIGPGCC